LGNDDLLFPKKFRSDKDTKEGDKGPEKDLQEKCENYLEIRRIEYIRVPDELNAAIFSGRFKITQHVKNKISKYLGGVADLNILFGNGRYISVELKKRGGKMHQAQRKFEDGVTKNNYYIIRSFDKFIKLVDKFDRLEA